MQLYVIQGTCAVSAPCRGSPCPAPQTGRGFLCLLKSHKNEGHESPPALHVLGCAGHRAEPPRGPLPLGPSPAEAGLSPGSPGGQPGCVWPLSAAHSPLWCSLRKQRGRSARCLGALWGGVGGGVGGGGGKKSSPTQFRFSRLGDARCHPLPVVSAGGTPAPWASILGAARALTLPRHSRGTRAGCPRLARYIYTMYTPMWGLRLETLPPMSWFFSNLV